MTPQERVHPLRVSSELRGEVYRLLERLPLTDRQHAVWACIAQGQSNAEIVQATGMAIGTVKVHISNLLKRIGCRNRVQAALKWHGVGPFA